MLYTNKNYEKEVNSFFNSIVEREVIFVRKELLKLPKEQWYKDVNDVYAQYKFCNVHRCYDRTFILLQALNINNWGLRVMLRWLASNSLLDYLLKAIKDETSDWYKAWYMANKEEGFCVEPLVALILKGYKKGRYKLVSGSFIVKRYGNDPEQLCERYYMGCAFRDHLSGSSKDCLKLTTTKESVKWFNEHLSWSSDFSSYCIVSDFMYLYPDIFLDVYDWTAFGPGAFRGINDLVPTAKKSYIRHLSLLRDEWENVSSELIRSICLAVKLSPEELTVLCAKNGYYDLVDLLKNPTMLDVEHWLCEYHKYKRGYSKNKYVAFRSAYD